jgi:acyl-coenzyme A synthetase/AMP-(fatty) acid ligase
VFMNDFPLTPSGKVQRHILREKFIVQQPAAP